MAFGMNAGGGLTSGDNNVFIGANSGVANNDFNDPGTLKTGSSNIYIGHNATPSSANGSNEVVVGGSSGMSYRGGPWTAIFDRRLKHDVKPLV